MAVSLSSLYSRNGLDQILTEDAAVCPKCRGVGSIVLMRRIGGVSDVDVCPGCEGRGLVGKKNGYSDLMPASIGGRS